MANLLVRNIEVEVVQALKEQSGRHGVSAEEEHRRILRAALVQPMKKSFSRVLQELPRVGEDADFERAQSESTKDVFD